MSEISPAPRKRAPSGRLKSTPLSDMDWVDAATDILVQENVRGIRIDALCKKLGVTKGSFYWHFNSRAELLQSMLVNWRSRMTLNTIKNLSRTGHDSLSRLRALIGMPRRPKSPDFAQIEQSIRDWGRRMNQASEAVSEVDNIRFEYFVQLFEDLGFGTEEAKARAYLAYSIMMGDSILHSSIADVDADTMADRAIELLTAKSDQG
jgi:AcrR family transcriptional regulator